MGVRSITQEEFNDLQEMFNKIPKDQLTEADVQILWIIYSSFHISKDFRTFITTMTQLFTGAHGAGELDKLYEDMNGVIEKYKRRVHGRSTLLH